MKILLTSLFLLIGLNQILARYVNWPRPNPALADRWDNYDYDRFRLDENHLDDDFFKFMMEESSEEKKDTVLSSPPESVNEPLGGLLGVFLGTFLENNEDDSNSNEKHQQLSSNENVYMDDSNAKESSKETVTVFPTEDKSDEKSDEKTPNLFTDIFNSVDSSEEQNVEIKKTDETSGEAAIQSQEAETELIDLTKSSEEKKNDVTAELTEKEIDELASLFLTSSIIGAMHHKVHMNVGFKDDASKEKEADELLLIFGSILDTIIEEELQSRASKQDNREKVEEKVTEKPVSSEENEEDDSSEDIIITTPKDDSIESEEEGDKNNYTQQENDDDLFSFVFHGIDDDEQQPSLSDHKYSVIEDSTELRPTSAPYMPEYDTTSAPDARNSIHQYVKLRDNLDTQQNLLQKHEQDLDKDFYAIISSNYGDESLNKFENDIYVVHEGLDRIKRNINAMQSLQSKLYFHKLVTDAINGNQEK